MLAVVFDDKLKVVDMPPPALKKGEALVRVRMAGLCNTDIEIIKGYMGYRGILGHEFVGDVVKCEAPEWMGRRVVGEINAGCGKCDWCKQGLSRHCPNRTVVGIFGRPGAFAEYVALPMANLHKIPKDMSDETAVFAEPVAACFEILDQVKIGKQDKVAVIGDGKLGALAAQVLAGAAPETILLGKHDNKLRRLKKIFRTGIIHGSGARPRALSGEINNSGVGQCQIKTSKYTTQKPGSFDVVVECSGSPSGLAAATALVRPRGVLVLKSTYHEKPILDTSVWVVNEITVVGSRCGRFEPALAALRGGHVNPLPLIDKVFPAEQALHAFEAAQAPGVFKVLLDFLK
jgi:threonine dehydrogenase-like Zn-dependent dehydrogenase